MKINNRLIMFFLAVGVLGASIYFVMDSPKAIFLIIGIAMVLGVLARMLEKIIELLEQQNKENQ